MKLTSLLAPLVAVALTATPALGQSVTSITPSEGAMGTILTIEGTGLDAKKLKPVLVADGEAVKKTKLRAVKGSESPTSMQIEVKKAVPGTFTIAFKDKKDLVGESVETFTAAPPEPLDVTPGTAAPNDEVDVRVDNLGTKRYFAFIAGKKAKIVATGEPDVDGITTMTIRVPKVAAGTWPLVVKTPLGDGILKNAISIPDADGVVPSKKIDTKITLSDLKPLKPKFTSIDIDLATSSFDVAALGGSKKSPRVLAVTIPANLEDIEEGDSFNSDPARIVYTETIKGADSAWFSPDSGWSIDVVSIDLDAEEIVLAVCGTLEKLTGDGPATTEVFGTIVSPTVEPPLPVGECEPGGTLSTSITGGFDFGRGDTVVTPAIGGSAFGVGNSAFGDPGGPLIEGITWLSSYDPRTQGPAVLENILGANTLQSFTLSLTDNSQWGAAIDPKTLMPTVAVTIVSNDKDSANSGWLTGTVTGTVQAVVEGELLVQTISGEFCTRWVLIAGS